MTDLATHLLISNDLKTLSNDLNTLLGGAQRSRAKESATCAQRAERAIKIHVSDCVDTALTRARLARLPSPFQRLSIFRWGNCGSASGMIKWERVRWWRWVERRALWKAMHNLGSGSRRLQARGKLSQRRARNAS